MTEPQTDIILDSITEGVFTVDPEFNITSFNRAAERITGVPREQALGQRCYDVFRADICQNACALRRTLDSGRELVDLRVTILDSDGRTLPISISTAVLRDDEGNMVGGVETFRDLTAIEMLRREIRGQYTFQDIISKNHEIRRLFNILPDVATSDSTVLIEGPSGSGKELFARALHTLSGRSEGPYVVVNCGALPDTLLESELFGYRKGAFTDARTDKPGRFALAEGGTIFLDEVGDISPALQVKLLRVLQEKRYEPLGATEPVTADVRVIAATNKPLRDLVEAGEFRDDLFYRLNVIRLELPPLARRREDIPLLVEHFIHKFNAEKSRRVEGITRRAMTLLMNHDYPGNVRELENVIEHAFVLCREGDIDVEHLPRDLVARMNESGQTMGDEPGGTASANPLHRAEAEAIREALSRHNGHRRRTAESLGIDASTLWRKMKKFGIAYPAT
jgi:PAS domain S-box-containing protein